MKKGWWKEIGVYTGLLYIAVAIYFIWQMFCLSLLKPAIQWSVLFGILLFGTGLLYMAFHKRTSLKLWGNACMLAISLFLWVGAIGLDIANSFIADITSEEQQEEEQTVMEEPNETEGKPFRITEDAFAVLISGIDTYGEIEKISRSDVNILAVVNPKQEKILLVSIPRDYYVPIYSGIHSIGTSNGQKDKLTHTGLFGPQCTARTLEEFFDIPIRYYVRVNFSSLIDIVDAVGGITVQSEHAFDGFVVGENQCDGKRALDFARERYSFQVGDRQRGKNQMKVIEAIVDKVTTPSLQYDYGQLFRSVVECVEMNFSDQEVKQLLQFQMSNWPKWAVESISVDGADGREYSYYGAQELYVMYPDQTSVDTAKKKMDAYLKVE